MNTGYENLSGFGGVYLEDSFVLGIHEGETQLEFLLDLVLRETHPRYHIPNPGEQYCYERATLVFPDVSKLLWMERRTVSSVDALGERDFGNIDRYEVLPSGEHELEGDWGRVRVESDPPVIKFTKEGAPRG